MYAPWTRRFQCLFQQIDTDPSPQNTRTHDDNTKQYRFFLTECINFQAWSGFPHLKRRSIWCQTLAHVMSLFPHSWAIHTYATTKACLGNDWSVDHSSSETQRVHLICFLFAPPLFSHVFEKVLKVDDDLRSFFDQLSTMLSSLWNPNFGLQRSPTRSSKPPKSDLKTPQK
jgi:hypothetical protein